MKIKLGTYVETGKPFTVDLDLLIQGKMGILANSGGGKSWLCRGLIEGAHGHAQIIVLDTEGEFSNIREHFDFVLAGKDGDIPAESRYADVLARRILELEHSLIVDLYELPPRDRILFVRKFLESLVTAPKNLWHDVLIILDEAHQYAPEGGHAESLNAVIDLASLGRKRGYCLIPATQRPAKLHKDAIAECRNKVIGLANWEIDRKRAAEELGFSSKAEAMTLRDLAAGEFYAVGRAFERGVNKIMLGATKSLPPKFGKKGGKQHTPAPSAKVKAVLAKLVDLPKEAAQEAQDKASLQAKVKELTLEVRNLTKKATQTPQKAPELSQETLKQAQATGERVGAQKVLDLLKNGSEVIQMHVRGALTELKSVEEELKLVSSAVGGLESKAGQLKFPNGSTITFNETPQKLQARMASRPVPPKLQAMRDSGVLDVKLPRTWGEVRIGKPGSSPGDTTVVYGACERAILTFLAARPGNSYNTTQVSVMSGYRQTSSGFKNAVSKLKVNGWIAKNGDSLIFVESKRGDLEEIGVSVDSGAIPDIKDWLNRLGRCEREIFQIVHDEQHAEITYAFLEEHTPSHYSQTSSGFKNAISRLNTLGLIVKLGPQRIAINPDLMSIL